MSNKHQIRLIFTVPNTDCLIQSTAKDRSFVRFKCVVWKLQSGHGKNMVRRWNMSKLVNMHTDDKTHIHIYRN